VLENGRFSRMFAKKAVTSYVAAVGVTDMMSVKFYLWVVLVNALMNWAATCGTMALPYPFSLPTRLRLASFARLRSPARLGPNLTGIP
jgi:hypothetical protein